jgi:hypothetical protein
MEILIWKKTGVHFSNFFECKNSKYPGLVHANFVSILKHLGQNNMIICLLGHRNHFDQSHESPSTQDMTPSHYAGTLHGTIRSQLNIVSNLESHPMVYSQKGNSTEVQIYRTM